MYNEEEQRRGLNMTKPGIFVAIFLLSVVYSDGSSKVTMLLEFQTYTKLHTIAFKLCFNYLHKTYLHYLHKKLCPLHSFIV